MKIIAVITDPWSGHCTDPWSGHCTDPAQVLKTLMHLVKTQRPPPGLDPTCLL